MWIKKKVDGRLLWHGKKKATQFAGDCFQRSRQEHLNFFLFFQSRWTSVSKHPPFLDRTNTRPAAPRPSDADEKRVSERRRHAKPASAPYYPLNGGGLITVTMTDGLLLDRWDETRGEDTKNMQGRIWNQTCISLQGRFLLLNFYVVAGGVAVWTFMMECSIMTGALCSFPTQWNSTHNSTVLVLPMTPPLLLTMATHQTTVIPAVLPQRVKRIDG